MTNKKVKFLPIPPLHICSPTSYSRVSGLPGSTFDNFSTVVDTELMTELSLFVKMSIYCVFFKNKIYIEVLIFSEKFSTQFHYLVSS